jgi:hypothetical protein
MPNESRIDQLREEAWAKGVVAGSGVNVAGGPIPRKPGYMVSQLLGCRCGRGKFQSTSS